MARRLTPSQFRSQLRQAESRRRAAIQNLNREIRRYNADVKRSVDDYNRRVRAHNARVRANRTKASSALMQLRSLGLTAQNTRIYESAIGLSVVHARLEGRDTDSVMADLAERETANSLSVARALLDEEHDPDFVQESLTDTAVTERLAAYSTDLSSRWSGAIFALNPRNPDASRHFCSSAREIIAHIINAEAPDDEVLARFPHAERTNRGTPTRQTKIHFLLDRGGRRDAVLEEFGEENIRDLSGLFGDLNAGTHGPAGRFALGQLTAIKTRVENAIEFVCEVVAQ